MNYVWGGWILTFAVLAGYGAIIVSKGRSLARRGTQQKSIDVR